MCYHQPYQLWWILLILFLLLELCSSVCYHGTCDVECHCHYDNDCIDFNGEYTDEFDVCRRGCDDGWEGIGCQNGNVAEGKEANQTDWIDERFGGNNSAGNCVDGSVVRREENDTCCGVAPQSHWEVSLGDVYVVNQLKLHRSDNARFAVRVTNISLFRDSQSVVELSTGNGSDPAEITTFQLKREEKINHIKVKKNLKIWYLRMCEVEVFGYQYKECIEYNSMYYYGPGCLQNCYCQEQCDYITGVCPGTCMAGYQHDSDGVCVCDKGTWGAGCSEQCHCRDQDVCDHVNGTCPNGCADVYTGATCQQLSLPTENDVHVVYTPDISEITIDVSLYSNISNYELIRTEGICHNSNGNHKVETSSQTAVISSLDSRTEYMCYVIPYIQTIVMNHQYTGNVIYNQTVITMAEDSKSIVIVVVVSVICVVLVAVLATVVVVFIVHRRKQTKENNKNGTSGNATYVNDNVSKHTAINYENISYLNENSHHGILVENLGSHIECAKKDGKLSTEYAELPTHDSPTEAGDEQANVPKNRFNNIKPFDHSRVVLQSSNNNETGN